MRGHDSVPASGGSIGRVPVAVGEIAVIVGMLDHAVQRDVFDDLELSHLIFSFPISGFGVGRRAFTPLPTRRPRPVKIDTSFEKAWRSGGQENLTGTPPDGTLFKTCAVHSITASGRMASVLASWLGG